MLICEFYFDYDPVDVSLFYQVKKKKTFAFLKAILLKLEIFYFIIYQ